MSSEASQPQIASNPSGSEGHTLGPPPAAGSPEGWGRLPRSGGEGIKGRLVVRLQRHQGVVTQGCDVYIGRRCTLGGWDLPGSKWANPFKVGRPEIPDIPSAVLKYWRWIHGLEPSPPDTPDYIGRPADLRLCFHEIHNRVKGCWCKDRKDNPEGYCHGDVLCFLADGYMSPALEKVLALDPIDVKAHLRGDSDPAESGLSSPTRVARVDVNRVRSMLMGVFLGDALGVPHEFHYNSDLIYTGKLQYRTRFISQYTGTRYLAVGQISDDGEMTLALARSLISNKGYVREEVIKSYLQWANSGSGFIGVNTRNLFKQGKTLQSYYKNYENVFPTLEKRAASQSNGSLMRCSPLACLWSNEAVIQDVGLTNPSKIVADAELTYVTALRLSLLGLECRAVWTQIKLIAQTPEVRKVYDDIESGVIRDLSANKKGWVLNSLYAAYFCFYDFLIRTDSMELVFPESLKWVITQPNTDTDTNAAITGALIGAAIGWDNLIKESGTVENILIVLNSDSTLGDFPRSADYSLTDFEAVVQGLVRLS